MKNGFYSAFLFAALAGITLSCAATAQQNGKPKPSGVGGSLGRGPSWLEPGPENCRQFKRETICHVGGHVSAPRLIFPAQRNQEPPTIFASSPNIVCPCTAVLWAVVGRDRRVHYPQLVRHLDTGLDRRAINWVKKWKFEPARRSNKPVAVEINLEVRFR
jgi:hypothetical protein